MESFSRKSGRDRLWYSKPGKDYSIMASIYKRGEDREILYFLSHSEKPYMVIMLSNTSHIIKQLDAATRNSLQPYPVYFRNYDADQIYQILRDRAENGDGKLTPYEYRPQRLAGSQGPYEYMTIPCGMSLRV
jgi:hypothetical protein